MVDAKQLAYPAYILLEDIKEGHQHIDLVFYATAGTFKVKPEDGEAQDLKWFTAEEIREFSDVPENVKICISEAMRLLK